MRLPACQAARTAWSRSISGPGTSLLRVYDPRETLRFTVRFFYEDPRAEIESWVAETLALVGLTNQAERPIKCFSGVERQRSGIAQDQVN